MATMKKMHAALSALPKKKPRKQSAATIAKKHLTAIKKPIRKAVRRKNPLQKYIVFVGPQFDKEVDAIAFAKRFATKYQMDVHVTKA